MNEREVFAFVLLNLVRGQCAANRSESVSRTGLQAQVPVKERAFARRGLSALIEHKALVMRGEQIGLTAKGHLYLDEHVLEGEERPMLDVGQDADLLSLRSAIRQDMRLSHDSIEAAQTLPGRLQELQVSLPVPRRIPAWRIALALVVVALVVYGLSRAVAQVPSLRTGVNGVDSSRTVLRFLQPLNVFPGGGTVRMAGVCSRTASTNTQVVVLHFLTPGTAGKARQSGQAACCLRATEALRQQPLFCAPLGCAWLSPPPTLVDFHPRGFGLGGFLWGRAEAFALCQP